MSASTQRKNRLAEIEAGTYKKQNSQKKLDEKKAKENRTLIICSAVVVVIVLAAVLLNLIPALQRRAALRPYTEGVAVTIDGRDYSPAEVSFYYTNQYNNLTGGYYGFQPASGLGSMAFSGMDTEDEQYETWRDYLLDLSYQQMGQVQMLLNYAKENNITLTAEEKEAAEANLTYYRNMAAQQGVTDVDFFLSWLFGTGVTQDTVRALSLESALASKAYNAYRDSLSFTPEELAEKLAAADGDYDSFSFAYYYVPAETGDEEESGHSDMAAELRADKILEAYASSETEDLYERFNGSVKQALDGTATRRDNTSGRYLSELYADWLKDEARQAGDVEKFADEDGNYTVVLFLDHQDSAYPTVNVRHILIKAEKADDEETWSEEALAAAKAEAERILVEWKEGDMTEESFAALAEQYSEDDGSNTNGGLYEEVYKGQMVAEFEDFCFAEGRQPGDTAVVYGTNGSYAGYHVVYYVGEGRMYSDIQAESDLISEALSAWLDSAAQSVVPGPDEGLVDPVTEPVAPVEDEELTEEAETEEAETEEAETEEAETEEAVTEEAATEEAETEEAVTEEAETEEAATEEAETEEAATEEVETEEAER